MLNINKKIGCALKHTVKAALLFISFNSDSLTSKIFSKPNYNSIAKLISKKRGYHLNKYESFIYSFFQMLELRKSK